MRRTILGILAFLSLVSGSGLGAPLTLYVAPKGDDQWSGRLAQAARDGKDGPLATLPAALQIARTRRASSPGDSVTILLRGGTYELQAPLLITEEDSGADSAHPLLISAYSKETPVISGGRRILGWKESKARPGLWETEVPGVREGKWYFHQLFINGQRKQRARTPNEGFFHIDGDSPHENPAQLHFHAGDIKPEWARDGDVEAIALLAWSDIRMQIRAVDSTTNIATLSGKPQESNREKDARYYIENAPDALDQPGEWYLDRHSGVLTYWPQKGETIAQAEAVAPYLTNLVNIRGDLGLKKPVHDVIMRGITFAFTDWTLGSQGYADPQAAVELRGDLFAEGATNCAIEDCVLTHLAHYAIELGLGCQRDRVIGNEIADLGAGGVRMGGPGIPESPFLACSENMVTDNVIHHLGRVFAPGVGILLMQSDHATLAHNNIYDLYYTAISAGWTWGYGKTACDHNVIEFNHLHDIGQSNLSDMGAVYTLGIQPGTVVRNNLIHDVNSYTYGGWGLYTDEGSTGIVLENNLVYRTKSAGFHQHYGRENVLRNNIFAFGKESQLMRTRTEDHTSFIFTNNIVYFDTGTLLASNWSQDRYFMDGNLYFDARPGASEAMKFAGADLEEWRKRGHDMHSIIADPLFHSAQTLDFNLLPGSPAFKLGFKPLDLKTVGPRPKNERPYL